MPIKFLQGTFINVLLNLFPQENLCICMEDRQTYNIRASLFTVALWGFEITVFIGIVKCILCEIPVDYRVALNL